MKFRLGLAIAALFWHPSIFAFPALHFYSAAESSQFLAQKDEFFLRLSPLDIALRTGSSQKTDLDEFTVFAAQQAREWNETEIQFIRKTLNDIEKATALLKIAMPLPKELIFIKTTGKEEFVSPYTRRNAIILPYLPSEMSLYHEFFHIFSRHNPQLREALYKIAGFAKIHNLQLPAWSRDRLITNPDSLNLDYGIQVSQSGTSYQAIPLNYSLIKIDEIHQPIGDLSGVFALKLLTVDPSSTLLNAQETDYKNVTRANSSYNMHPEEILADHFQLMIYKTVKDPGIHIDHIEPVNELTLLLQSLEMP